MRGSTQRAQDTQSRGFPSQTGSHRDLRDTFNQLKRSRADPKTEEGKSLLDRITAETQLLRSLKGDAFDKEYMSLVTNTQQSVSHFLESHKAAAKDPAVKRFMGDKNSTVQKRLKTAQDILAKVYGDSI